MKFRLSGAVVDTLGSNSGTPFYLKPQKRVNSILRKSASTGLPALSNERAFASAGRRVTPGDPAQGTPITSEPPSCDATARHAGNLRSCENFYGLGAGVGRALGVGARLGVGVGLGVEVGVAVEVAVGVAVGVGVGVNVAVGVAVGVGLPHPPELMLISTDVVVFEPVSPPTVTAVLPTSVPAGNERCWFRDGPLVQLSLTGS